MKMEGGLINSVWRKIKKEDESHEEKISFKERVIRAYKNKNTLEYNEAVEAAEKLKKAGYISDDLMEMDEDEVVKLLKQLGSNILDPAVAIGAKKRLEENKTSK